MLRTLGIKGKIFLQLNAVIFLFLFFFFLRVDNTKAVPLLPWTYPRQFKVLVIGYLGSGNYPVNNAVDRLAQEINRASVFRGDFANNQQLLNVNVVGRYYWNELAPHCADLNDKKCAYDLILNRPLINNPNNETACDLINSGQVDQVWFAADSQTELFVGGEYEISHPTQVYRYCNQTRSFSILYLDLSTTFIDTGRALHSFGHYMEILVTLVQGSSALIDYTGVTAYGNTNTIDAKYGLRRSCGNVHTPPNALALNTNPVSYSGYDYGNTNTVSSSCDDWKPTGDGVLSPVNYWTWDNIYGNLPVVTIDRYLAQETYLMWWLAHMPNINNNLFFNGDYTGVTNRPLPSWLDFVVDMDATANFYYTGGYWINPKFIMFMSVTAPSYCSGVSGNSICIPD